MSRPLMQNSITDLEKMFSGSPTDLGVLSRLENELKFRQTQRAAGLLQKVEKAVAACSAKPPARPTIHLPTVKDSNSQKSATRETPTAAIRTPLAQPELWSSIELPSSANQNRPQPVIKAEVPVGVTATTPAKARDRAALPKIEPLEAYKLLGVEPTTRWEIIEDRRRRLVQQAHPDNLIRLEAVKRTEALAVAQRINLAYAVLLQLRIAARA